MTTKRKLITDGASSSQKKPPAQPKRKGGIRKSPTNPHGIIFKDDDQRKRYEKLVQRPINPTKYFDEQTLRTLGLLDEVNWMIDRVGWNHFVTLKEPTYEALTLEFLSSVHCENLQGYSGGSGFVTFRLLNRDYTLTLAQFNDVYGFPIGGGGSSSACLIDFSDQRFWLALSKTEFHHTNNKASNIHNPCFWYVHRFMAHTIFGRGESHGSVRKSELLLLWAMINAATVDTGSCLARQFQRVGSANVGSIEIGGLITPIARKLEIDLSPFKSIPPSRVDLFVMMNARVIVKVDDTYHLVVKGHNATYPLPCEELTKVRNRNSWIFPNDTGTYVQPLAMQLPQEAPLIDSGPSFAAASSSPLQSSPSFASLLRTVQELSAKQDEMHRETREDRHMPCNDSSPSFPVAASSPPQSSSDFASLHRSIQELRAKQDEMYREAREDRHMPRNNSGPTFPAAASSPPQSSSDFASLHRSIQELRAKQDEMHHEAREDRHILKQIFAWLLTRDDFPPPPP